MTAVSHLFVQHFCETDDFWEIEDLKDYHFTQAYETLPTVNIT